MTTTRDLSREKRLRRAAQRQGLTLTRSSRRDPRAIDFGRWWITDQASGALIAPAGATDVARRGLSLDDVEAYLFGPPKPEPEVDRRVYCYSFND